MTRLILAGWLTVVGLLLAAILLAKPRVRVAISGPILLLVMLITWAWWPPVAETFPVLL